MLGRIRISRRDFLSGSSLLIANGLTPRAQLRAEPGRYYPPALTGLRGSRVITLPATLVLLSLAA